MTTAFGISDLFTLTRASSAWFFNEQGLLESVGNDAVRFAYDPVGLAPLGWLIEQAGTNSCLDSQDLTTGNWSLEGTPTRAQDAIGLDGVANAATTLTDADGGAQEGVNQGITIADNSDSHTASIFILKDADVSRFPHLRLQYTGGTGLAESVVLNTSTGAFVEDDADGLASIEDFGLWWRVILTIANNTTGNVTATIRILAAFNSDGTTTPAVAATGAIIVGHAQLEEDQAFASNPIVTTSSAVTRDADGLESADIDWFNDLEGTLFVEMELYRLADGVSLMAAFAIQSTDNTNSAVRLISNSSSKMVGQIREDSSTIVSLEASTAFVANTPFKFAFAYKTEDSALAFNGVIEDTDTNAFDITDAPAPFTESLIGSNGAVSQVISGYIKTLKYYPKRLTNAELIALTT